MDLAARVELFTAVMLILAGLSHLTRPKAWAALFTDLLKLDYAGLWIGALTLPLGLVLIITHNTWTADLGVIVTVLGWAWTLKAIVYLLAPAMPPRKYMHIVEKPRHFVIAGVGLCLVGAAILVHTIPMVF